MTITLQEQKDDITNEWLFNVWTDSSDWCCHCNKEKNKLAFDDQTKTTQCVQCGHVETYPDDVWNSMQAQRYVSYKYMPGKYYLANLTKEEIFQKYLREHNHNDWTSWLIHDYILAKMRKDKTTQNKLLETAKQVVEKMQYDPEPWKTLFEKMDTQNPEILHQVPQIIYEFAQKKFIEATPKENLQATIQYYIATVYSIYNYNRWKDDRIACWISSEILKLCNIENSSTDFTKYYSCDPLLENFSDDILTNKKREINLKDTYIQWELNLANSYLTEQNAFAAVWSAYKALAAKLELHTTWPPKTINFDITTVKKVSQLVNDPELFRFYDLATDLNTVDTQKACYYAKYFIKKVQELLPKITTSKQEQTKSTTYIT
jgi:hypothetical protein